MIQFSNENDEKVIFIRNRQDTVHWLKHEFSITVIQTWKMPFDAIWFTSTLIITSHFIHFRQKTGFKNVLYSFLWWSTNILEQPLVEHHSWSIGWVNGFNVVLEQLIELCQRWMKKIISFFHFFSFGKEKTFWKSQKL